MAVTYQDLFLEGMKLIEPLCVTAGDAQREVREVICTAAGKTFEQLSRDIKLYTTDAIVNRVRAMYERRKNGEPLAYITGWQGFFGIDVEVNPSTLIPRTDTEVLVARTLRVAEKMEGNLRVLDLCAGTGCVGLAIANDLKNVRAVLVDSCDGAVELCKRNIRHNKLTGRVVHVKGDALQPPSPALGRFDILVSNPPYIPSAHIAVLDRSVRDYEPRLALDGGEDGLTFYRAIGTLWRSAVKPGGLILCEVGIGQSGQVGYLFSQLGYEDVRITRDHAGIDRVVEARVPEEREYPDLLLEKTEEPASAPAENAGQNADAGQSANAGQNADAEQNANAGKDE